MKLIVFAAIAVFAVPALAQAAPQSTPATATTENPPGGYAPPPAPPPPPGSTVVFKEAPPPDVAFPPPAPLASYPVCKRGQFDKCVERNSPK